MQRAILPALLFAAPAAAAAPAPVRPEPVTITMTHDGFIPRQIALRGGAPIVLRVVNRSDKGHNLTQEVFFREARIDPADRAAVRGGKIALAPGERVTVRLTVPRNGPGATYQFSSTVLGDAAADYKGVFVIR